MSDTGIHFTKLTKRILGSGKYLATSSIENELRYYTEVIGARITGAGRGELRF